MASRGRRLLTVVLILPALAFTLLATLESVRPAEGYAVVAGELLKFMENAPKAAEAQ